MRCRRKKNISSSRVERRAKSTKKKKEVRDKDSRTGITMA